MNLYLISRKGSTNYDEYDSAVVVAESEDDAKTINPYKENKEPVTDNALPSWDSWVKLSEINCKLLGTAEQGLVRGVVCASYNAG